MGRFARCHVGLALCLAACGGCAVSQPMVNHALMPGASASSLTLIDGVAPTGTRAEREERVDIFASNTEPLMRQLYGLNYSPNSVAERATRIRPERDAQNEAIIRLPEPRAVSKIVIHSEELRVFDLYAYDPWVGWKLVTRQAVASEPVTEVSLGLKYISGVKVEVVLTTQDRRGGGSRASRLRVLSTRPTEIELVGPTSAPEPDARALDERFAWAPAAFRGAWITAYASSGYVQYACMPFGAFRSEDGREFVTAPDNLQMLNALLNQPRHSHFGWFRSTDGGKLWEKYPPLSVGTLAALAIDGATMFAGDAGGKLMRSDNDGADWTTLDAELPVERVRALTVWRGVLYLGSDAGVHRSVDRGETWESAESFGGKVVNFSATDSRLYAATPARGIYVTEDGESWSELDTEPPSELVTSVLEHQGVLYVGTADGLFTLIPDSREWREIDFGIASPIISHLSVIGAVMYAGTNQGLYYSLLPEVLSPSASLRVEVESPSGSVGPSTSR